MKVKPIILIPSVIIVGAIIFIASYYVGPILIRRTNRAYDDFSQFQARINSSQRKNRATPTPVPAHAVVADSFSTTYAVKEAGSMDSSQSPGWWLSSGAYFYSANGVGNTVSGTLPALDPWRIAYLLSNTLDTDGGYLPQNIFRLVLRSQWQNYTQEAYFKILKDNLTASPNRNASNGLFFFNRYQDAFNVYYTGLRVDGYAVIKKKINGTYYTMAYQPFIRGPAYNAATNPDVLPKNTWIGLRSVLNTESDGTVSIKFYIDSGRTGHWVLAAETRDDSKTYGGAAIRTQGYAGIRTDFMDVQMDDFKISAQ